ncbi:VWA domain-containing protein [Thiocystis violascens]|uniref:Nicotinate-mononucleotide:5, 6-dimethylbenzimidazole phosphoribosyltransferase CobT n=1 Tax=Thiocystis violascens (strain ATCC 17096 / DSM 198 / 6111) TaxID=765911 RepID=I3Y6L9_THIV6|nr:VWA domain-containing protein [Thiocystis violascens]AFL72637.1 nicotinate-mononucleotide:5,6-dimethylbenzimidazole phosphoribosyltransferase CobT [Thiocystis violascens DSM 198]
MQRHTITNALPIVAAAYGRKFGIPVQVSGSHAWTDGTMIQIPEIRDDATSKTLAFGYLAHEAGHVRYTDFGLPRHLTPLGRHLENIIEDIRIEAEMIQAYPGTRTTLDSVIETLMADGRMSEVNATDKPVEILSNGILALARHRYRQQPALATQAKQADRVMRKVLGSRFVHRLQGLMSEIPRLTSTADSIALAAKIVALVEEEASPEAEPDEEEEGTRQNQEQGANRQDQSGNNPDQSTQPKQVDVKPALQAALDATDAELPADLFESVAETLGKHSGDSPTLLPALEQYAGDRQQGQLALNRVKVHSAKLTARLQGLIEAHTLETRRSARRGRMLSTHHLHRAAVGDSRIFRLKERKVAPNTALHLLVDLSGSMAGGQDVIALDAAMALALALETTNGVSRAVSAFPGIDGEDEKITRLLSHDDRVSARAGAFVQRGRGGTPMTGALWFAVADLLARRETRKVVVTLTDGGPDDFTSAAKLVRQATVAGIQMIGVGIGLDVSRLFPVAIRIHDIADLKRELFQKAEQLLIVGG